MPFPRHIPFSSTHDTHARPWRRPDSGTTPAAIGIDAAVAAPCRCSSDYARQHFLRESLGAGVVRLFTPRCQLGIWGILVLYARVDTLVSDAFGAVAAEASSGRSNGSKFDQSYLYDVPHRAMERVRRLMYGVLAPSRIDREYRLGSYTLILGTLCAGH
jgi:hypothetical protein